MTRRCPVCGGPVEETPRPAEYPFCSGRCRMIDLGNWLSDRYRISEELEGTVQEEEENPRT